MRLVPVYAGEEDAASAVGPGAGRAEIHVDGAKQQSLGIRVAAVENSGGIQTIRTTGRVAADENRLYRLNTSSELWIRKVYPPATGSLVRKDEPLLEFYSANFLSAAAAYMYALNTRDRQVAAKMTDPAQMDVVKFQIRQAVESLQNLGVSDADIARMERERKPRDLVTLRSPLNGFVLSRTATMGQWVGASTELYQIADLSRIWIFADLFENEARFIRPGLTVGVRAPNRGATLRATVSRNPPLFDAGTRTMTVRLESGNPGMVLWPGMFVDVEFPVHLLPGLTIPSEAIVETGLKKIVYVDRGGGNFEGREVEMAWRFGDRAGIAKGLESGERVVVAGNFLIDSESRMKAPAPRASFEQSGARAVNAKDPVCGMEVNPAKAAGKAEYEGRTYYFCSEPCKEKFEREPSRYTKSSRAGSGSHAARPGGAE